MAQQLMQLPFAYDELEPGVDSKTVEIHYSKHHQGYVNKLNKALENHEDLQGMDLEEIMRKFEDVVPAEISEAVMNNGGGVLNHNLYWEVMTPGGASEPQGKLKVAIENKWGDLESFKEEFLSTAKGQFASGWGWLVLDGDGELEITSTRGHITPLIENHTPIMCTDVWEHAYYLKYQNERDEYLANWWKLINWDVVSEKFEH
jgi:Fe-Mn family superoxide dismutase